MCIFAIISFYVSIITVPDLNLLELIIILWEFVFELLRKIRTLTESLNLEKNEQHWFIGRESVVQTIGIISWNFQVET